MAKKCCSDMSIFAYGIWLNELHQDANLDDTSEQSLEIDHIEARLAATKASSSGEAAIQLMLAHDYVERVREGLVLDSSEALDRVRLILLSAMSVAVSESGIRLGDFGGTAYAPQGFGPVHESRDERPASEAAEKCATKRSH